VTTTPTGVRFRHDTLFRTPTGKGDNWCLTWAADDSQITAMCDGDWLGSHYHSRLGRISGGPDGFDRADIIAFPNFAPSADGANSWFTYGVISIDGVIYAACSKTPGPRWSGPFRGVKLLRSADNGRSWQRVSRDGGLRSLSSECPERNVVDAAEMFFLEEHGRAHVSAPAYPFAYFDFIQQGRDHSSAPDDYVYIHAPEGAHSHQLMLARASKHGLGRRDAWAYFAGMEGGSPTWSHDLADRSPSHTFPDQNSAGEHFGWYSWLPSVVWNPGLGLYVMVTGGTYAGRSMTGTDEDYFDKWMHEKTGSLGFYCAEQPWGPWTQVWYCEHWTADDPANLTYQPKLSPKWISADGEEMVLIWSDAMRDADGRSHTTNYTWNQMKIRLTFE